MKRSAQVGLVLAAAVGVGGTSYAVMPRDNCVRADGGAPIDPSAQACRSGSSSGGSGGGHGSRSLFGSYGGSSSASATPSSASALSAGSVQRGGFGGFFHSIGAHIGG